MNTGMLSIVNPLLGKDIIKFFISLVVDGKTKKEIEQCKKLSIYHIERSSAHGTLNAEN